MDESELATATMKLLEEWAESPNFRLVRRKDGTGIYECMYCLLQDEYPGESKADVAKHEDACLWARTLRFLEQN